jgi:integrase
VRRGAADRPKPARPNENVVAIARAGNAIQVLRVIEPLWTDKAPTASRIRGRIERVLDWATVRGYRTGDNPARWKGHLSEVLPAPRKVAKLARHPALPYAELPAFMAKLSEQEGVAARALEFLILTATRTSEVTGARWDEIDFKARTWTIAAARMKAGKEHRGASVSACPCLAAGAAPRGCQSVCVHRPEARHSHW